MALTALVFGASGQDGHYLCELLRERGDQPIGVARSAGWWETGDVADQSFVSDLVQEVRPDLVFHLAANSTTRHDTSTLYENHATIATGTLNLLEAVYVSAPTAKVFITGSGVQFAQTGRPVSERDPFEASSPYAIARISSAYAARYYRSLGVRAYVGYLFHHDSPRRRGHHVSQQVISGLRAIARGATNVLEVADPSVEREWLFAGDAMRGVLALVDQDAVYEAAIGSGVARPIDDWITACAGQLSLRRSDFTVAVRPGFVPEYRCLVSDPTTIKSTGWAPLVSLEELAGKMVHE